MTSTKILTSIIVVIVAITIGAAIFIMEPPSLQRQRKLDARRIDDLRNITRHIETYWQRHKSLPTNLVMLSSEPGSVNIFTDPVTATPYVYVPTGKTKYKLCATFGTDSSNEESQPYYGLGIWSHKKGYQCFDQVLNCEKSGRCG